MNPLSMTATAALAVPLTFGAPTLQGGRRIDPTNAISVCFTIQERYPVQAVSIVMPAEEQGMIGDSMDWLALGQTVIPSARPMTPEERSAVNEFFWSQFG
jgi:hypothetical protein